MRKESAKAIIHNTPLEMQEMLRSVYQHCALLLRNGQRKLLERILFAMSIVNRRFFVGGDYYLDTALSIGRGQTISQPSTVAAMLLYADVQEGVDVLEVGSGSGWNASLLSYLVYPGKVTSLERFASLSDIAMKNVAHLKENMKKDREKVQPVFFVEDIFSRGRAWKRKYNKILFTAGVIPGQEGEIEEIARELLLEGGILVCPRVSGSMLIFKKDGIVEKSETKECYMFVPLKEGVEK